MALNKPSSGQKPQRSVFASLVMPVILVVVLGIIGWLLLISVKWLIVALLFAVGAALIVVPIVGARRLIGPSHGAERRRRLLHLAMAVVMGAALIVLAVASAHHGWLLIVVPVVIFLIGKLVDKISTALENRRQERFHQPR